MTERIRELVKQAGLNIDGYGYPIWGCLSGEDEKKEFLEKFAELIIKECTGLLFDESEFLYGYSTECDNMRESEEAEMLAEKCVDLITMIERHFGVK
jgi:hypothetical protein